MSGLYMLFLLKVRPLSSESVHLMNLTFKWAHLILSLITPLSLTRQRSQCNVGGDSDVSAMLEETATSVQCWRRQRCQCNVGRDRGVSVMLDETAVSVQCLTRQRCQWNVGRDSDVSAMFDETAMSVQYLTGRGSRNQNGTLFLCQMIFCDCTRQSFMTASLVARSRVTQLKPLNLYRIID